MIPAKKSLGQNFLRSKAVIDKIVATGRIALGETALEAGPGEGVLTEALLKTGAKVIAVEKDRRLIPLLQQKFSTAIASGKLTLVEADILDFDICSMFHVPCYKVIANLPYYITGAFIRKFLEAEHQPSIMILLLQKEVAERIVAKNKKESLLSISVKVYGTPRYIQTVKAGSFSPPPKVDSAILAIENVSKKFFVGFSEEKFFALVKAGFAHKRKRLAGNLKAPSPNIETVFAALGIDKNARAEELTLATWRNLAQKLKLARTRENW